MSELERFIPHPPSPTHPPSLSLSPSLSHPLPLTPSLSFFHSPSVSLPFPLSHPPPSLSPPLPLPFSLTPAVRQTSTSRVPTRPTSLSPVYTLTLHRALQPLSLSISPSPIMPTSHVQTPRLSLIIKVIHTLYMFVLHCLL